MQSFGEPATRLLPFRGLTLRERGSQRYENEGLHRPAGEVHLPRALVRVLARASPPGSFQSYPQITENLI